MPRLHVLVTNDDGVDSHLLKKFVSALTHSFVVTVAVPREEQSWIGKAVSRRGTVKVEPLTGWECPGWVIDGTPTDCVNIAMGHLLDTQADAVVSGINIGYNTTLPLIFSSGTISGALEGACWGLPAFAFSQRLAPEHIGLFSTRPQTLPEQLDQAWDQSATRAASLTAEIIAQPAKGGIIVHNINLPIAVGPTTRVVQTAPEQAQSSAFFRKQSASVYIFTPPKWEEQTPEQHSDRDWLHRGVITHSVLDYARIYDPQA